MKIRYIILFPVRSWIWFTILHAMLIVPLGANAQQGSQGNTTIFGGVQMTFFSNHDFVAGGGGAQPGVILTERAAGNFGVLNFAGDNLTSSGTSDAGYVDGYVRKYGAGQFIFPVGDNGSLGQFAAGSADETMGAYFHSDPSIATTSNLFTGTDYTALPSGGPFFTGSKEGTLRDVSTIEYWDIDGANPTTLTLTWDAGSSIAALTSNNLSKLTIVGWDGTQWVMIPSEIDATSILGGASDLTTGSITTRDPLAPDTYIAYTFGILKPLPVTLASFTARAESNTTQLNWATTEETNSDRFEIQRSFNGKNWKPIGTVRSHGESSVLINYNFVDNSPGAGENLYRLKMIDYDKTYAYSTIRNVSFKELPGLKPYPNPVTDRLFFKDSPKTQQAVLHNASGVKVFGTEKVTSEGIDVTRLPQGIYTVTITLFDGTINTHKVAVTR
jgi:hypothetical protein